MDFKRHIKTAAFCLGVYIVALITFMHLYQPLKVRKLRPPRNVTVEEHHGSTGGYVVAVHFSDQQTCAMKNLMSLQCWAGHSGTDMAVVEPYLIKTQFGVPFTSNQATTVTFQDLFDIQQWEEQSYSYSAPKFAQLVSWNSFLSNAPRAAILVEIRYANGETSKDLQKQDVNCTSLNFTKFPMDTLLDSGFAIVRKVCLNYEYLGIPTLKEVNSIVYGSYSPSSVSVMFQEWRGITNISFHRVRVFQSPCYINNFADFSAGVRPSWKITNDAHEYISQHLGNEHYIAVMLRLEHLVIVHKNSPRLWRRVISFCLENLFKVLSEVQAANQLKRVFISMDVGKYGSKGWRERERAKLDITEELVVFLSKVYNETTTLESWEQSFESVSESTNPAYIATLQSMVASQADYLILSGRGFFQERALQLHLLNHSSDHSYVQIEKKSCAL